MFSTTAHSPNTLSGMTTSPASGARPWDRHARLALGLTSIGFLASVICLVLAGEGVHHFDDLTHYLYAEWAWAEPRFLLDAWGRPGFTALYFLPSGLGWTACRLLSAFLTAASAWLAFAIARQGKVPAPWVVVPLAYAQPLFFQLSQTTLTETPLAFYLTLAVYLAGRGAWGRSCVFISLATVTRHEAILFIPLWFWAASRQRVSMLRLWPLVIAPVALNVLTPIAGMTPPILMLLAPSASGQYGSGGWLTFFCRSLEAWGPATTVLAIVGVTTWRRQGTVVRLSFACAAIWFGAQTAVRALGLYDSGGYSRFLVPIGPLVAIAALAGWHELQSADRRRRRRAVLLVGGAMLLLCAAMERQLVLHARGADYAAELPELHQARFAMQVATAAVVGVGLGALWLDRTRRFDRVARRALPLVMVALAILAGYGLSGPLRVPEKARVVEETLAALDRRGLGGREILSAHIWIDYRTGRMRRPGEPSLRERLERAAVGSIFIWERQFAGSADYDIGLDETRSNAALRLAFQSRPLAYRDEPYLWVFEKIAPWPAPGELPDGRPARDFTHR
jgi:predicted small lipoprotein YifL